VYKEEKRGYNDNSQKIRKYLSSPKEASGSAEAAFSGVSAMFEGLFLGILGVAKCCQAKSQCLSGFPAFYDFT